ncbi:GNAT family N-acetyltransferase [Stigmatella aurantiaca]|uniref:Acyl-CoA N-acyltransferase n=1 Tax=Stigmatella aurantiaca (strain DW4/3-1) TaxID=378806 RepID=Q08V98_STIAD|nr:GNAT family N-acetyltransferase [Stigmatella aurantiaca]ADO73289.1 Acyl-CoA N-acyltransferase [Stigmatella aurantiaca DW4/3-1]EAU64412.1 regulatory protein for C-P lyase [Stigmatella aurantiaca DW4/3-1]
MLNLTFRKATLDDLPVIVSLLADDVLGAGRESVVTPLPDKYLRAFEAVDRDENQFLLVVEDRGSIVGTLQLTFIPGIARGGAWRGQIEAVRVSSARRGERVGEAMFAWAIETCRQRGCALVQLTTDKSRSDAHRFYERLGFAATHAGYKLNLSA